MSKYSEMDYFSEYYLIDIVHSCFYYRNSFLAENLEIALEVVYHRVLNFLDNTISG